MGKLKKTGSMTEQSYRYPKDTWEKAEAKKHCTDHGGKLFEPAEEDSMNPRKDNDMGNVLNFTKGYSIRAQADKELEIFVYEEIGYEGWDGEGITAQRIAKDLKDAGDIKNITVRINSPGGRVFEAVAIYNILKQHKARVRVMIDGLAASSASIVAMCGDEIEMANNAMMMIHKPWSLSIGTAEDLRRDAEMLDKVEGSIIQTYLNQCDKRGVKDMAEQLAEMLAAETWMNADEALGYGLIDTVTETLQAAALFDLSKFNFKRTPEKLRKPVATDLNAIVTAMDFKCRQIRAARSSG
jgi:ATP-dependent Clp endopeptidase proteolytic subunit ClpP